MEGDAGTSQLNPTDQPEPEEPQVELAEPAEELAEESVDSEVDNVDDGRRPSRIGRGVMAAVCAGLLVLTVGGGIGGYLAWRSHQASVQIADDEADALAAAKDCVTATHAPDTQAMVAAQTKIIECSTGDFGTQAGLYSGMLLDAYQAANVTVKVADMRAAVEKHNPDGSIDLLVAVRTLVSNTEKSDEEQGWRLRVKMARDESGQFKVARLDQVTS